MESWPSAAILLSFSREGERENWKEERSGSMAENTKKIGRSALKRGYLTCRGHIVVCVGVNVNDL